MVSYRDVCNLQGIDTLKCLTERLKNGLWKPWGPGIPYKLHRKPVPPRPIPQWVRDNWEKHTIGNGIWITDNSRYKNENGGSFESGHHSWFEKGAMHTQSFSIVKGEWSKRRFYIWKQKK